MKKIIKTYTLACDDCGRHDMQITVCIGCGVALCSFCSSDRAKGGMGFYASYRDCFKYEGDNYAQAMEQQVHFCHDCTKNPTKHKISTLLDLCKDMDKFNDEWEGVQRRFDQRKHKLIDKLYEKMQNARRGKYCLDGVFWWEHSDREDAEEDADA